MLVRAAVRRRGTGSFGAGAMIVATATATAMLNLLRRCAKQTQKEFRSYGANIVLWPKDGQTLSADALQVANAAIR